MICLIRSLAGVILLSCLLPASSVEWPYPRLSTCVPGSLCSCSYSPKFEEHIFCPGVSVFIGAYLFSRHTVIVSCNDDVKDSSALSVLTDVSLVATYDTLRVVNCPLPNNSFADIFSGGSNRFQRLELDTMTNFSVEVKKKPFERLKNLTELVLRVESLQSVSADAFEDLEDLSSLTIVLNRLQDFSQLPVGLFANKTNLAKVRVVGNIHKDVSLDDITPTINDLVYRRCTNKFSYGFPLELFWNMRSLSELSLSNCRIQQFSQHTFTNSSEVRKLELSHNLLTELEKDTLKDLENLIRLDLSHNQITFLPEGLFGSNKKLLWLNLNYNLLKVIPSSTFVPTTGLYILDLSHNLLEAVAGDQFQQLGELGYLDLSSNRLSGLRSGDGAHSALRHCRELWSLDLSNNSLTEVYDDWGAELHNLKMLNLSHNAFTSVQLKDLLFSSNITLDLSHNRIEFVNISTPRKLNLPATNSSENSTDFSSTSAVFLDQNPFNCNCSLIPFVQLLVDPSISIPPTIKSPRVKVHPVEELRCGRPTELENVWLGNASKSEFFTSGPCPAENGEELEQ